MGSRRDFHRVFMMVLSPANPGDEVGGFGGGETKKAARAGPPFLERWIWFPRSAELFLDEGDAVVAVHAGDVFHADFLRAGGFALVLVGAIAESFGVHLSDHGEHAFVAFRLALREQGEVAD